MRVALLALHECPGAQAGAGGVGGLATYIRGLSFELQGQILTIRLTLERAIPGGRTITKTVRTSVRVVN